ncbi:integrase_H2C2 domain-containing protein [Trichonephila clavipes]|nr:integrase_H2C2 domain-containing protein [Trichonephila clavipes]
MVVLCMDKGSVFQGNFRKNVLEELHAGHLGIVKMKAIARSFVYWKNIDNDIEEAAKNCVDCARYKADPPKSKSSLLGISRMPWNDGVLHYIIDVQGTLVRRHVDQIRPVGDKVQENIIPLMHQRFPSSEVRENNSNIQHAETAEDISKDRNKELGSSSVQGVPSTDVAVPDLSQSSAKETDSRRGVHQFQTGHYLGVPGESGGLRRACSLRREEMWYI